MATRFGIIGDDHGLMWSYLELDPFSILQDFGSAHQRDVVIVDIIVNNAKERLTIWDISVKSFLASETTTLCYGIVSGSKTAYSR